jgi:rod shape-determining protein MreC
MYQQPSGSRRIFTAIILLVIFIVVVNLPVLRESAPSRVSRKLVLSAIYPIQYTFNAAFSGMGDFAHNVLTLWGASEENRVLKSEVAELQARVNMTKDLASENDGLKKDLGFKLGNPYGFKLLPAMIISRSPSNWFESVLINKGSADEVSVDQAVVCSEGIVGRISEVGRFYSKVMLVTDPGSSMGVMIKRSKELGVAVGGAMSYLQIKYLQVSASLEVGEEVLTSGVGGVFPKGIPVGVISKTSARDYDIFRYVEIKPLVQFSKLDRVFVIMK